MIPPITSSMLGLTNFPAASNWCGSVCKWRVTSCRSAGATLTAERVHVRELHDQVEELPAVVEGAHREKLRVDEGQPTTVLMAPDLHSREAPSARMPLPEKSQKSAIIVKFKLETLRTIRS